MNYYDELIEEIESLFEKKEYDEILLLCKKELSIVYIPGDYEKKIREYFMRAKNLTDGSIRMYDFMGKIESSNDLDLSLCLEQLIHMNLQDNCELVQSALNSKLKEDEKGLLIHELIKQQVFYDFNIIKDGLEITFNPCYLDDPLESDNLKEVFSIIKDKLVNISDKTLEIVLNQVVYEIYCLLPLEIDDPQYFYELTLSHILKTHNIDELSNKM